MHMVKYGKQLALAVSLVGLQSGAGAALAALYEQAGKLAHECVTERLVALTVLMPLQEIETASIAELTAARENHKQMMEPMRSQRNLMENQLGQLLQQLQSHQADPAEFICVLAMQRMQILCNSFAVTEPELDQPVITPAECSHAIVRHTEALVTELHAAWDARNLEYRDEKHMTAGLLADLTGVIIQMTTGAATTLWFAHNLSLAQFEALLKEHRAFLCSVIPPLSETIDRIMKQQ